MTSNFDDIFTEAESSDDTLAHLGPLRALAGTWSGDSGVDVHPQADGPETDVFTEVYVAAAIDAQANGPQLFYGLRYHQHILKPGEDATFHDQVGYWLWEPETGQVMLTLAIPRGQVALAGGVSRADATEFTLSARRGDPVFGISSNPFLDQAFRTREWSITVTVHSADSWSYEQTTVLEVRGETFAHSDRNTLHRVGPPIANPLSS